MSNRSSNVAFATNYYLNAIEYLKNADCSLMDSLDIAKEYGYTIDNINSEVLASLLASRIEVESFYFYREEIESFFYELESEN